MGVLGGTALWILAGPDSPLQANSQVPKSQIGPEGGSVPLLNFAIVGDTRPSKVDGTSSYPTAVITKIYQDIEALTPHPDFSVSAGDYMFATPGRGQAAPQAALYVKAARNFSGQVFPAIGNHECTGYTKSDCGPNGPDQITENYTSFLNDILGGFGIKQKLSYYTIHINSSDTTNPWTAKFVFVAPNAWDSDQAKWLNDALGEKTTYTFVVKHEPYYDANACPGCGESDAIIKNYPATLLIFGHTHTYQYIAPNQLVVGNGGAPLDSTQDHFGFIQCRQQMDNTIQCQENDYDNVGHSSYPDSLVTVKPDGSAVGN
jgi:hypothetical protein